jgi:hypothetical protein
MIQHKQARANTHSEQLPTCQSKLGNQDFDTTPL